MLEKRHNLNIIWGFISINCTEKVHRKKKDKVKGRKSNESARPRICGEIYLNINIMNKQN